MSNLNTSLDLPRPTSPPRSGGRHQARRSLTEFTSPVKLHRHHHHHTHQDQHHQHHRRKDHHHDDKGPPTANTLPLIRNSLDMPLSGDATPYLSPDQSRRASVHVYRDDDAKLETRESREARLRLEQEKAAIRAECAPPTREEHATALPVLTPMDLVA